MLEYTTGSAASHYALAGALLDFIDALGGTPKWTIHNVAFTAAVSPAIDPGYITEDPPTAAPNDAQITLRLAVPGATPSECFFSILTGGHASNPSISGWTRERMAIVPHTGFANSSPATLLTSYSGGPSGKKFGMAIPKSGSMNYHFWADDTYLVGAIEITGGWWQSFYFGISDVLPGLDGGYFALGTTSNDFNSPEEDYNSTEGSGGTDIIDRKCSILGLNNSEGGAGVFAGLVLAHENATIPNGSAWNGWSPIVTGQSSSNRGAHQFTPSATTALPTFTNFSFVGGGKLSPWYSVPKRIFRDQPGNATSPLVPLFYFIPSTQTDAGGARLWIPGCRSMPGVFYVSTEAISPGDTISVDGDDYFVFPALGTRELVHGGRYVGVAVLMP